MALKPGTKLQSAVCEAQVIVVKAPEADTELACGGAPLVAAGEDAPAAELDPALADGPLIGKRYVDDEIGLELLCTRGGSGTLTAGGTPLVLKGAKPLPASD